MLKRHTSPLRGKPRSRYGHRLEQVQEYEQILYELRFSDLKWQITQQIRRQRIGQGLTQAALAQRIGLSQPDISRLETLQTNPTIEFIQKVVSGLRCQIIFGLEATAPYYQSNQELRNFTVSCWNLVQGDPPIHRLWRDPDFRYRLQKSRQHLAAGLP